MVPLVAGVALLLIVVLASIWFCWPTLLDEREQARRRQAERRWLGQIDEVRRRTLRDMDYVAERARRNRLQQSSERLDEFIYENDL